MRPSSDKHASGVVRATPSTFVRGWSLVLALLFSAFAAYISLVPFRFAGPPDVHDLIDVFVRRLEMGMTSRGNFIANLYKLWFAG